MSEQFVKPPLRISLKGISVFFNPVNVNLEKELELVNNIVNYYIKREKQVREEQSKTFDIPRQMPKRARDGKFLARVKK